MSLRAGPAPPEHGTLYSFPRMIPTAPAAIAARAVLSGPFTVPAVVKALALLRSRPAPKTLTKIATLLTSTFGEGKRPRLREVTRFFQGSSAFARLFPYFLHPSASATMQPAAGPPSQWNLPPIVTEAQLAAWLGIDSSTLHHLSSPWRADHEAVASLRHYHYHWVARKGRLPRLIEAPLPRLKGVQQRILHGILAHIPAHPSVHGFVRGRDIVTYAAPHVGQRCVLRMDVRDFFPTIRRARVLRIFLNAGYPEAVALTLANLCTATTPAAIRHSGLAAYPIELAWPLRQRLQNRHLPQGAATSPALANLAAYRLDCRLSGLAQHFGATYTRYADDLLFSGADAFRREAHRCEIIAGSILLEEGFSTAHRKTKIMPSSVSQRAAGLVLNQHPALPRRERDALKAILTNCLRHGPSSQNRSAHPDFRAHLLGRLSHAAHICPAHVGKLRIMFDNIVWET